MKKLFHKIVYNLVRLDIVWYLIAPFVRFFSWFQVHRNTVLDERRGPQRYEMLERLCGKPLVKSGPFIGMKYPNYTSFGSAIFPKIIGCYEREIAPIIEQMCLVGYKEIIDVGCAEGYYAIGFALRIKEAKIFAYDIDARARIFCKQLAELNNVSHRIIVGEEITPDQISTFPFSGRSLIICDCEGFEKTLFDKKNVKNLTGTDLLIEMHDFIDIHISSYILQLFEQTHQIQIVQSIDDLIKAREYEYPELKNQDISIKKQLVSEGRPCMMEWIYLKAKFNQHAIN